MDEHIQQLLGYIRQQFSAGQTPDHIAGQLLAAGWPQETIDQAFAQLQAAVMPTGSAVSPQPISQQSGAAQVSPPAAGGKRKGRIRTGWQLFKQSVQILNGNRYLLRYLAMTAAWVFGITAAFTLLYHFYDNALYANDYNDSLKPLGYVFTAVDYVLIYFFINYYAAALTANVFDIFQGKRQPYKVYIGVARSKIVPIFVFSLLSATIGFVLRYVIERIRFVGWILAWILGTAWSLGTLFVIPIIVAGDKPSGVKSIKQSVTFFKDTWGENITSKVTVNAPLFFLNLVLFGLLFLGILAAISIHSIGFLIFVLITGFILLIALAVIGSFANSLINIALFYYATYHVIPPAFSQDLLNQVFIKGKRNRFGKKIKAAEAA